MKKPLTTLTPRWEILTQLDVPLARLDTKTSKWKSSGPIVRVKYRPIGSRGRFENFAIVDGKKDLSPEDLGKVVDTYNREKGPQAWRGDVVTAPKPIQNFDIKPFRHRDGGWCARIEWTDEQGVTQSFVTKPVPSYAVIGALAMLEANNQELIKGVTPARVKDIDDRRYCQVGPQAGSAHYFSSDGWCIRCGAKRGD